MLKSKMLCILNMAKNPTLTIGIREFLPDSSDEIPKFLIFT